MDYGGLLRLDQAFATGFLVETGLYSLPGMTSARRLKDAQRARSAWVFLIFSILMYLVATLHITLAAIRFYKSLFLGIDPRGAVHYLKSWRHWEYFPLIVLFCVQTWLGDALVIYRCYFVWNGNLLLIFVPACLLLASIAVNLVIWYWVYHPSTFTYKQAIPIFKCIYPLAFVQNFMTTGLIILKIFLQHRTSRKAGIVDMGSTLSLIRVLRILVESAAIYTIQLLALIILYFVGDNGQYVVQAAISPSIGITFVLLAIRIQPSKTISSAATPSLGITGTFIPQWLGNADSDIDVTNSKDYGGQSWSKAEAGTEMISMDIQGVDALNMDDGCDDSESSSRSGPNQSRRPVINV